MTSKLLNPASMKNGGPTPISNVNFLKMTAAKAIKLADSPLGFKGFIVPSRTKEIDYFNGKCKAIDISSRRKHWLEERIAAYRQEIGEQCIKVVATYTPEEIIQLRNWL